MQRNASTGRQTASFVGSDRGLSSAASVAVLVAVTVVLGLALAVFLFMG